MHRSGVSGTAKIRWFPQKLPGKEIAVLLRLACVRMDARVKTFRHLALAIFFVGIAALEIAHGLFRLQSLREAEQAKGFEAIEREFAELGRSLRQFLLHGREHAAYLASAPGEYTYTLAVSTEHGGTDTATVLVGVVPVPEVAPLPVTPEAASPTATP